MQCLCSLCRHSCEKLQSSERLCSHPESFLSIPRFLWGVLVRCVLRRQNLWTLSAPWADCSWGEERSSVLLHWLSKRVRPGGSTHKYTLLIRLQTVVDHFEELVLLHSAPYQSRMELKIQQMAINLDYLWTWTPLSSSCKNQISLPSVP